MEHAFVRVSCPFPSPSTLVRPSKYLVLITSYQISNFLQSTNQVSSLHLSPLDSARGEKVARREACSIVVRQHYSRSRYARGSRRLSVHRRFEGSIGTITFQTVGRSGETRFDEGFLRMRTSSFSSTTMVERVFHPSMTRLPCEIDVISRGLCVSLLRCWNESTW